MTSKLSKKALAWLAVRKRASQRINPKLAIVDWAYRSASDPYDVFDDRVSVPVTREFFVRNPRSKIWVWSGDLPRPVWRKLRTRR